MNKEAFLRGVVDRSLQHGVSPEKVLTYAKQAGWFTDTWNKAKQTGSSLVQKGKKMLQPAPKKVPAGGATPAPAVTNAPGAIKGKDVSNPNKNIQENRKYKDFIIDNA